MVRHESGARRLGSDTLVRRYAHTPSAGAFEEAFMAARPLAIRLASRYRRTSVPREDLEQAAYVGLMKAIRRFDPARGCAFSTYAVPTILGEIRRQCREAIWAAHVPRPVRERVQRMRSAADDLSRSLRRSPTTKELARRLRWDEEQVVDAALAENALASVPLDAPSASDGDGEALPAERVGAVDEGYELAECRVVIEEGLRRLPEEERCVLRLRFADERTFAQIGDELGVAPSQAIRVFRRSLDNLSRLSGQDPLGLAA
jgi:RNA polymerase sigma-B factor